MWQATAARLETIAIATRMTGHLRHSMSPLRSKTERQTDRKRAHQAFVDYVAAKARRAREVQVEMIEHEAAKRRATRESKAEDEQAEDEPSGGDPVNETAPPAWIPVPVLEDVLVAVSPLLNAAVSEKSSHGQRRKGRKR